MCACVHVTGLMLHDVQLLLLLYPSAKNLTHVHIAQVYISCCIVWTLSGLVSCHVEIIVGISWTVFMQVISLVQEDLIQVSEWCTGTLAK